MFTRDFFKDGSDSIDWKEWQAYFRFQPHMSNETNYIPMLNSWFSRVELQEMWEKLDTNKDGK